MEPRETLTWTSRLDKFGNVLPEPITRLVKDLETDHIINIIRYIEDLEGYEEWVEVFKQELRWYRNTIYRSVGESIFLVELENLCKTWGISISHEDEHGAFILTNYSQEYMDWLKDAQSEFDRNKSEEKPEEPTVTVDDILKA